MYLKNTQMYCYTVSVDCKLYILFYYFSRDRSLSGVKSPVGDGDRGNFIRESEDGDGEQENIF